MTTPKRKDNMASKPKPPHSHFPVSPEQMAIRRKNRIKTTQTKTLHHTATLTTKDLRDAVGMFLDIRLPAHAVGMLDDETGTQTIGDTTNIVITWDE